MQNRRYRESLHKSVSSSKEKKKRIKCISLLKNANTLDMTQIITRTVKFQLALSCADMTSLIIAWFSRGKFSIFYATEESMKLQVLSHLLNAKIINSERYWIRRRVGGKMPQQHRQRFGIWEIGIQTLAVVFSLSWLISQAVQFSGFSFCNKEIITHTNLTGIWGLDIS